MFLEHIEKISNREISVERATVWVSNYSNYIGYIDLICVFSNVLFSSSILNKFSYFFDRNADAEVHPVGKYIREVWAIEPYTYYVSIGDTMSDKSTYMFVYM